MDGKFHMREFRNERIPSVIQMISFRKVLRRSFFRLSVSLIHYDPLKATEIFLVEHCTLLPSGVHILKEIIGLKSSDVVHASSKFEYMKKIAKEFRDNAEYSKAWKRVNVRVLNGKKLAKETQTTTSEC